MGSRLLRWGEHLAASTVGPSLWRWGAVSTVTEDLPSRCGACLYGDGGPAAMANGPTPGGVRAPSRDPGPPPRLGGRLSAPHLRPPRCRLLHLLGDGPQRRAQTLPGGHARSPHPRSAPPPSATHTHPPAAPPRPAANTIAPPRSLDQWQRRGRSPAVEPPCWEGRRAPWRSARRAT